MSVSSETRAHGHGTWADPVGQLLALRGATKSLMNPRANATERFGLATELLVKYKAIDFPYKLRPVVARIFDVRQSVRRDYAAATRFEFGELDRARKKLLEADLVSLYEACLLDIGRFSNDVDAGVYEIVYPAVT